MSGLSFDEEYQPDYLDMDQLENFSIDSTKYDYEDDYDCKSGLSDINGLNDYD